GIAGDDVAELAAAVEALRAALDNGDLDRASLEFTWDGTRLGVRQEGAAAYDFVDLRGPVGQQGEKGDPGAPGADGADGAPGADGAAGADGADGADGDDGRGLEFAWDGTRLGGRYEGEATYTYVDLVGPQGEKGDQGLQGEPGLNGA